MFDINTIITQAINAAVKQAVDDVLRHTVFDFATPMTEMRREIGCLEAALEQLELVVEQRTTRIAALENNPAQGVDTQTARLITADAFVDHLDKQEWFWEKVSRFVANNPAQGVEVGTADVQRELDDEIMGIKQRLGALEDADEKTLDSDDVEAMIERALDDHCSTYNHDDYDEAVSTVEDLPDFDDFVSKGDLQDAINEALNGATISISV